MLSVLADTAMTGRDVSALLPVLVQAGRHDGDLVDKRPRGDGGSDTGAGGGGADVGGTGRRLATLDLGQKMTKRRSYS